MHVGGLMSEEFFVSLTIWRVLIQKSRAYFFCTFFSNFALAFFFLEGEEIYNIILNCDIFCYTSLRILVF